VGEYVVFLPDYSTQGFLIYNTRSKVMKIEPKRNKRTRYKSAVNVENRMYMIPFGECSLEEIAVFEPSTESISYPLKNTNKRFLINVSGNVVNVKEIIYVPLNEYNQILKLNLKSGNYEVLSVGMRKERYSVIVKANEGFFLSGEKEFIYWWDGKNTVKEIPLENRSRGKSIPWEQLFSGAVIFKNHIIFSPVKYSSLIGLSIEDLTVKYLYEFDSFDNVSWGMEKLNNNVFFSTTPVNLRNGKQYLVSDINNELCVREKEIFKPTEDMDLCRYGIEYSDFALKKFINKVINL
jgi:hypothetical protein